MELFKAHAQWANRPEDERFTSLQAVYDATYGYKQTAQKATVRFDQVRVKAEDGDPLTKWGIVQGLTRHSQTLPYADQRTTIDRAAGKILEVRF